MSGLPDWNKLKNEVGPWNEFNIIRGKEHIKLGNDVWVGYFCLVDETAVKMLSDTNTDQKIPNFSSLFRGFRGYTWCFVV